MSKAIICDNVHFSFKESPLLQGVSFAIERGECTAFIGPNGSGKTTMLNLILGFLSPQKGTLTIAHDATIGYVPQSPELDRSFPLTVLDVVEMGCAAHYRWWGRISKEGRERAFAALEQVGLLAASHEPFGALSGGQAQRALIARALADAPDILVLDEPTANIDTESEQKILSLIQTLKKKATVIMVTHDFETITHFVDRVLLFKKTVQSMKPETLCKHYAMGIYHEPEASTKEDA